MLKGNQNEVEKIAAPMPGAEGAFIQWLVDGPKGAENFYMRRIVVEAGGQIPEHAHPEEHEIYVLTGQGEARGQGQSAAVAPGDYLFVPGGEKHSFVNTGSGELTFICCINAVKK